MWLLDCSRQNGKLQQLRTWALVSQILYAFSQSVPHSPSTLGHFTKTTTSSKNSQGYPHVVQYHRRQWSSCKGSAVYEAELVYIAPDNCYWFLGKKHKGHHGLKHCSRTVFSHFLLSLPQSFTSDIFPFCSSCHKQWSFFLQFPLKETAAFTKAEECNCLLVIWEGLAAPTMTQQVFMVA